MNNSVQPLRRQQRGFSLLEILAALAIGMVMMISLTAMVDTTLQDTKGQQAAQYQAQFTAAALRYLNDNATTLRANVSASASGTFPVPLGTLQPAYLPAAFANTNAYGQAPCMLVRNSGTPNQLDALIVTEGGEAIPVKDIGYIAANAGTGGGSIRHVDPSDVTTPVIALGAFGAWKLDTAPLAQFTAAQCSAAAGVGRMASLLSYGGPNAINRNALFRNPSPSDPTLNQMNVPLGFSASAMAAVGDSGCTPFAITLETGTGNILKCNTTTTQWETSASRFWKDPVATFGALASVSPLPSDGEVRMALDTNRAFMFKAGAWNALAIDENDNFNVPNNGTITVAGGNIVVTNGNVSIPVGTLAANNVNATTNVTALSGNVIATVGDINALAGNVTAQNNVTALAGNVIATVGDINALAGDVNAQGNVVATVALVGDSVSTSPKNVGDFCNYFGPKRGGGTVVYLSAGTIVTDSFGRIMECKPIAGPGSNGSFIYVDGTSTTPP